MGTLLFDRVEEKKYRSGLGEGFWWDLTFVFRFRPNGWNWLLRTSRPLRRRGSATRDGLYFAGTNGPDHYYAEYAARRQEPLQRPQLGRARPTSAIPSSRRSHSGFFSAGLSSFFLLGVLA